MTGCGRSSRNKVHGGGGLGRSLGAGTEVTGSSDAQSRASGRTRSHGSMTGPRLGAADSFVATHETGRGRGLKDGQSASLVLRIVSRMRRGGCSCWGPPSESPESPEGGLLVGAVTAWKGPGVLARRVGGGRPRARPLAVELRVGTPYDRRVSSFGTTRTACCGGCGEDGRHDNIKGTCGLQTGACWDMDAMADVPRLCRAGRRYAIRIIV